MREKNVIAEPLVSREIPFPPFHLRISNLDYSVRTGVGPEDFLVGAQGATTINLGGRHTIYAGGNYEVNDHWGVHGMANQIVDGVGSPRATWKPCL